MEDNKEAALIEECKKIANEFWEKECKEEFNKILRSFDIKENELDFIKNDKEFEESLKNFNNQFQSYLNLKNNELNQLIKNENQNFQKPEIKNNKIFKENNNGNIFANLNENSMILGKYFDNLKKPLLVGLGVLDDSNILLNPILHCLTQLNKLIRYYLNPQKYEKICALQKKGELSISPSFVEIIKAIWNIDKKKFSLNDLWEFNEILRQIISQNNGNYLTNDPGMFIRYILLQLHKELDKSNPNEKFIVDKNIENNESFLFQSFLKFRQNHITKIQNLFFSIYKISQQCEECGAIYYNFESVCIIDIYLIDQGFEEKKNLQKNLSFLIDNNTEKIIKKNCNICLAQTKHKQKTELYSTNEIIVININRSFDKEKMISLDYPEHLDLSKIGKFCDGDYELCAVIKKNNNNNKYLSYCKSFANEKWYRFDNEEVVLMEDYKQYIFDNKNAMVIFYSKN